MTQLFRHNYVICLSKIKDFRACQEIVTIIIYSYNFLHITRRQQLSNNFCLRVYITNILDKYKNLTDHSDFKMYDFVYSVISFHKHLKAMFLS